MSTRRLIALALTCGLAILVAGGVWLVLAGRSTGPSHSVVVVDVGEGAAVGPVQATLRAAQVDAQGEVVLDVEMVAIGGAVANPAQGWAVLSNRGPQLVDRLDPQPSGGCPDGDLASGTTTHCKVFFMAEPSQIAAGLQAVYGHGTDRAVWPLPQETG